jgi:TfoX/Sxy family transcriptional regulator of competence genes
MAYDTKLGERIRAALKGTRGFEEKKMFGGVGFTINGNLACGVNKNDLLLRVGLDNHNKAMTRPHVKPFDTMGKPMAGWILVEPDGCRTDKALADWIKMGVNFAKSLPPK